MYGWSPSDTWIASALKESQRTVLEMAEEGACVIDADRLLLARLCVHSFFDKRLGHRREIGDRSVKPNRRVDTMG